MRFKGTSGAVLRATLAGLLMVAGRSGLQTRGPSASPAGAPAPKAPAPGQGRACRIPIPAGRWAPRLHDHLGTSDSTNWAGYAVTGHGLTSVQGSWIVPAVTSVGGAPDSYSANWAGLDGYNSSTVEQLGTESDMSATGQASYYAWFEMYPQPGYYITLPNDGYLAPGDPISARVVSLGNGWFLLGMINGSRTHGWSFQTYQRLTQAGLSSAEWITEAPWYNGVLPLANFGTTRFSNCQVGTGLSASRAYGSTIGPTSYLLLDQWITGGKPFEAITMADSGGGTKATPSAVSSATHGFSITWNSYH